MNLGSKVPHGIRHVVPTRKGLSIANCLEWKMRVRSQLLGDDRDPIRRTGSHRSAVAGLNGLLNGLTAPVLEAMGVSANLLEISMFSDRGYYHIMSVLPISRSKRRIVRLDIGRHLS